MRLIIALALGAIIGLSTSAAAQEPRVYLFWAQSCPYSQAARAFLLKKQEDDPKMKLVAFETEGSLFHSVLLAKLFEKIGLPGLTAVPSIVIGTSITIGFIDDATTGKEVMGNLATCRKNGCSDVVESVIEEMDGPEQAASLTRHEVVGRVSPRCSSTVQVRSAP
jgi:hypothetical protein